MNIGGSPYDAKFYVAEIGAVNMGEIGVRCNKKNFVSGYPTVPNFYMPTLIFFSGQAYFSTSQV